MILPESPDTHHSRESACQKDHRAGYGYRGNEALVLDQSAVAVQRPRGDPVEIAHEIAGVAREAGEHRVVSGQLRGWGGGGQ